MKKVIIFLVLCLSFVMVCKAQTKRRATIKRTATTTTKKATAETKVEKKILYPDYGCLISDGDDDIKFNKSNSLSSDYFIVEAPGYTQKELYDKMIVAVTSLYDDGDQEISKIEDSAITINASAKPLADLCRLYTNYGKHFFVDAVCFKITFQFKDGRIRIDLPVLKSIVVHEVGHFEQETMSANRMEKKSRFYMEFDKIIQQILTKSYSESNDW